MTKIQRLILAIAIVGLAIFLGCASVQDLMTPAYIPPQSVEYTGAEPTTLLPFTTLFDLRRIDRKMDFVYLGKKLEYDFLKGVNAVHIMASEELQTAIFSPEGPIGLAFPMLFGGTLGALLIKRPKDRTADDYDKAWVEGEQIGYENGQETGYENAKKEINETTKNQE